jgi:hypothetical protein
MRVPDGKSALVHSGGKTVLPDRIECKRLRFFEFNRLPEASATA